MIYGLYLSASGVLTSSYRQDVIANNLANAETVGFKRDVALFRQRLTEAQQQRVRPSADGQVMEELGGGIFASPNTIDTSMGELEPTGNPLDVAIAGNGYFAVQDKDQVRLTRAGQFMVDREGFLVSADGMGRRVLDDQRRPIQLEGSRAAQIDRYGMVSQEGQPVARLGVWNVADPSQLRKQGGQLFSHPNAAALPPSDAMLQTGFLEQANIDPARELAALIESQRQLEANANMIRYQDQMLAKLVGEVGKIS